MMRFVLSCGFVLVLLGLQGCSKLFGDDCYSWELERNHSGVCLAEFDPVCGCDGVTYSNNCIAEAAGITSYCDGVCE